WEQPPADNEYSPGPRNHRQHLGEGNCMNAQDKSLQESRSANQFLQAIQASQFHPAQYSRPLANIRFGCLPSLRQCSPVAAWSSVMFDVVAIVEEDPIVESTVVTHRAPGVFEAPMNLAESEAHEPCRQINGQQEPRRQCGHRQPEQKNQ